MSVPNDPVARPFAVTAAAVLAFLMAAVEVILAVGDFTRKTADTSNVSTGLLYTFGGIGLVLAVLLVWGGIAAITGRTAQILSYTAVLSILVAVVATFLVDRHTLGLPILPPVVIAFLLVSKPSKEFFGSRSGQTT